MSQALQIIDELEVALKGNSTERHLSILKSVTGLFLAGHDRLTEEVSSVFDGVMVRLIEHVESRARFELSRSPTPRTTSFTVSPTTTTSPSPGRC
jgi:hypothetical protein